MMEGNYGTHIMITTTTTMITIITIIIDKEVMQNLKFNGL